MEEEREEERGRGRREQAHQGGEELELQHHRAMTVPAQVAGDRWRQVAGGGR